MAAKKNKTVEVHGKVIADPNVSFPSEEFVLSRDERDLIIWYRGHSDRIKARVMDMVGPSSNEMQGVSMEPLAFHRMKCFQDRRRTKEKIQTAVAEMLADVDAFVASDRRHDLPITERRMEIIEMLAEARAGKKEHPHLKLVTQSKGAT